MSWSAAQPPPPPNQLFQMLDAEEISREQFHAAMRIHAEALIGEMEEAHRNPIAAAFEELKRRFAVAKLTRRTNEEEVREIFTAMSELPDFPPALHIWNAAHKHVPLHCFLRPSREPVFRVLKLDTTSHSARILVEYGAHHKKLSTREEIEFTRGNQGRLILNERRAVA